MASDEIYRGGLDHEKKFQRWQLRNRLLSKIEALKDPELQAIFKMIEEHLEFLDRRTWEKP